MRQTAPGRYEADFPLDRYGSFLLHAALEKTVDDGRQDPAAATVAESFGHVTNPYPREYLALAPDVDTLRARRSRPGGTSSRDPRAPFDPAGESIRYHEDLWPRFVGRRDRAVPARPPGAARPDLRPQADGARERAARSRTCRGPSKPEQREQA